MVEGHDMGNFTENKTCAKWCWIFAAVAGIVVAFVLWNGSWNFIPSAFIGLLIFIIGGALLSWSFCKPQVQETSASSKTAEFNPTASSVMAGYEVANTSSASSKMQWKMKRLAATKASAKKTATAKDTTVKATVVKTDDKDEEIPNQFREKNNNANAQKDIDQANRDTHTENLPSNPELAVEDVSENDGQNDPLGIAPDNQDIEPNPKFSLEYRVKSDEDIDDLHFAQKFQDLDQVFTIFRKLGLNVTDCAEGYKIIDKDNLEYLLSTKKDAFDLAQQIAWEANLYSKGKSL